MKKNEGLPTIWEYARSKGISRRDFIKTAALALPPALSV